MSYKISLYQLADSIGKTADLVDPQLSGHHKRVAYIASQIAQSIGLSPKEQGETVMAAMIHDIGGLTTKTRLEVLNFESGDVNEHAIKGAKLLEIFEPLKPISKYVEGHHTAWKEEMGNELIGAHIIHLADRVDSLVMRKRNILLQSAEIRKRIEEESGKMFNPKVVRCFLEVSQNEAFWLDILNEKEIKLAHYPNIELMEPDILQLGLFFSQLIDFRSRFTATHSSGIAAVASGLVNLMGYSSYESMLMCFAGYVHDIGKLAVPTEIIEKPDKLTNDEYALMKSHTYYTYQVLDNIKELNEVKEWAAYHHEKVDGTGYPFGIRTGSLDERCHVMKVADIFTALTEERPYRDALKKEQVLEILYKIGSQEAPLMPIIKLLDKHYEALHKTCFLSQQEAITRYEKFIS